MIWLKKNQLIIKNLNLTKFKMQTQSALEIIYFDKLTNTLKLNEGNLKSITENENLKNKRVMSLF